MKEQTQIKMLTILKESFIIIKQNWFIFLIYIIINIFPILFITVIFSSPNIENRILPYLMPKLTANSGYIYLMLEILLAIFIVIVLNLYLSYTIISLVRDSFYNVKTNYKSYFNEFRKKGYVFFTTIALYWICFIIGFSFLFVPALIVSVLFIFHKQAFIIGDKKNTEALRYSYNLIKNRFREMFLIFIIILLWFIEYPLYNIFWSNHLNYLITVISFRLFNSLVTIFSLVFFTIYFLKLEKQVNHGN